MRILSYIMCIGKCELSLIFRLAVIAQIGALRIICYQ